MSILVIAAHPDDEVLGMGGTIARMVSEGEEVNLLIVSDGSTSQYRDSDEIEKIITKKKMETQCSCKMLGINGIIYGSLPDMKLDTVAHIDINCVIEEVIQKVKPCTIYTHFYGDVNLDHQLVYKSTIVAARPFAGQIVKKIYAYRVPSSTEWSPQTVNSVFIPNEFVDINEVAERKYEAMKCYETELRKYPHPRSIEYLRLHDEITGAQVGMEKAEAFMLLRCLR